MTVRLTATNTDALLARLAGLTLGDDEWILTISELPEVIQIPPAMQAPPARAAATQLSDTSE